MGSTLKRTSDDLPEMQITILGPTTKREEVMESIQMTLTKPSREWLEGSKKRLEIAHRTRFSDPRVTLDVVIQVLSELLERLENENKTI
jgi:hypothetical protein